MFRVLRKVELLSRHTYSLVLSSKIQNTTVR